MHELQLAGCTVLLQIGEDNVQRLSAKVEAELFVHPVQASQDDVW